jgi:hypothetical protein
VDPAHQGEVGPSAQVVPPHHGGEHDPCGLDGDHCPKVEVSGVRADDRRRRGGSRTANTERSARSMPTTATSAWRAASNAATQRGGLSNTAAAHRAGSVGMPGRSRTAKASTKSAPGSTSVAGGSVARARGRAAHRASRAIAASRAVARGRCQCELGPVEDLLEDAVVHRPDHARPEQPHPPSGPTGDDVAQHGAVRPARHDLEPVPPGQALPGSNVKTILRPGS